MSHIMYTDGYLVLASSFSFYFISKEKIFSSCCHLSSDHLHFIIYNQTLNARLISQDAAINLHTTLIIYADSTSSSLCPLSFAGTTQRERFDSRPKHIEASER